MPLLFIDMETDNSEGFGLDPFRSKVVTFQAMTSAGKPKLIKDPESLEEIRYMLENWLIVGSNLQFEAKFLKHHFGIALKKAYDVSIAENIISGGLKPYTSLKELASKYCGVNLDKTLQCSFVTGETLTQAQVNYALQDIIYLPEIMSKQLSEIKRLGLKEVVDIEMKALPAVAWMELSGIKVDLEKLREIALQVEADKKRSEEYIIKELTRNNTESPQKTREETAQKIIPNINSSKDLLVALKAKGCSKLESTKKGELLKYYQGDHLISEILIYRSHSKLISSFINPLLGSKNKKGKKIKEGFIHPKTGRIHSNFNQYGARSGRLTSKEPNMQQQPSRIPTWRTIFVAEPGNKIVTADYSQIEFRIAGQLAKDPKVIKAYQANLDLHKETAVKMFKTTLAEVTDQQREIAKTTNFGLNYGLGALSLKGNLKTNMNIEISENEAKKLKRDFQEIYPNLTRYLEDAGSKSLRNGYVKTCAGRICKTRTPGKKEEDYTIKNRGKNLPIQGICADMLKISMGNLFLILEPRGVKLINSVHDELVFECKAEEADEVAAIVKTEMEKAGSLFLKDLPCVVKVTIADYWKK